VPFTVRYAFVPSSDLPFLAGLDHVIILRAICRKDAGRCAANCWGVPCR